MGKMFFGDTLFGNSRSWKRSQGQTPKNYFEKFLMANLESLVNFPEEYCFVTHIGLVDFELKAFLLWWLSPNIFLFKGTDQAGTFISLKCVVYYANYRSWHQSSKIQVVS